MKVVPFINTMLDEQYRVYILEKFKHEDIIYNFKEWSSKDMIGWVKFITYDSNISFEFYGEGNPYKIKNPDLIGDKSFRLPYPKNLNEFIYDSQRCFVNLQWHEDIILSMNRIVFMNQSEIEDYNKNTLSKIDKE